VRRISEISEEFAHSFCGYLGGPCLPSARLHVFGIERSIQIPQIDRFVMAALPFGTKSHDHQSGGPLRVTVARRHRLFPQQRNPVFAQSTQAGNDVRSESSQVPSNDASKALRKALVELSFERLLGDGGDLKELVVV
jgi:hypothetical protein